MAIQEVKMEERGNGDDKKLHVSQGSEEKIMDIVT